MSYLYFFCFFFLYLAQWRDIITGGNPLIPLLPNMQYKFEFSKCKAQEIELDKRGGRNVKGISFWHKFLAFFPLCSMLAY